MNVLTDEERTKRVLTAYGLLWLVHGDFHTDTNARLGGEARRQLMGLLSDEDRKRGIALGKARAITMGIDVEAWTGRAGL